MESIFKNKTVAFVGLAPNILGKNLGAEIDSHDLVYRTNIFPVENPEDYGAKCDVISVLDSFFDKIPKDIENIITFSKHKKSKFVVTPQERLRLRGWCMLNFELDIFDGTAGFVAYWLCQIWGAKSIKFYGITGYQDLHGNVVCHSDNWRHYTESAYGESFESAKKIDLPNYDCHNLWNQNYIFKLLLEQKEIEMDQFSEQYFINSKPL